MRRTPICANLTRLSGGCGYVLTVALSALVLSAPALAEAAPEPGDLGQFPLTAYSFDLTVNKVRFRMERYDDKTHQALDEACIPNPLS